MMVGSFELPTRFSGFEGVAYGGYAAGRIAGLVEVDEVAGVAVSLRSPPPVGRPLRYESDGDRVVVWSGETLVAEASAWSGALEVPAPPSLAEAVDAEGGYPGHHHHAFPRCFGCGPERGYDDGLRLFTGPVGNRHMVAASWCPPTWTGGDSGPVAEPLVWSALDCPGAWAHLVFAPSPGRHVTVRMAARLVAPVQTLAPHVVVGWPISAHGRKRLVGSAIFDVSGRLRAYSEALWLAISRPNTIQGGSNEKDELSGVLKPGRRVRRRL
ncbi:MAG: hypothetical protein AB7Q27_20890 [Acidimicrobiia bacterium]